MASRVEKLKNYLKTHKKLLLITIVVIVIVESLLAAGLVPTYDETDLSRKFSYFFPIWIIAALYAHAMITENIKDAQNEEKKEEIAEEKKEQ